MNYRQIETSREIRLWVTQIITPVAIATAVVMADPTTRFVVLEKAKKVKNSIKEKFKKNEA